MSKTIKCYSTIFFEMGYFLSFFQILSRNPLYLPCILSKAWLACLDVFHVTLTTWWVFIVKDVFMYNLRVLLFIFSSCCFICRSLSSVILEWAILRVCDTDWNQCSFLILTLFFVTINLWHHSYSSASSTPCSHHSFLSVFPGIVVYAKGNSLKSLFSLYHNTLLPGWDCKSNKQIKAGS